MEKMNVNNEKKVLEMEYDLIEKLINVRKEKGLSQRDLCKLIGMKQPYLVKIETRKISPSLSTVFKIINALNLEVNLLEKDK